jgi:hypothetical protein
MKKFPCKEYNPLRCGQWIKTYGRVSHGVDNVKILQSSFDTEKAIEERHVYVLVEISGEPHLVPFDTTNVRDVRCSCDYIRISSIDISIRMMA